MRVVVMERRGKRLALVAQSWGVKVVHGQSAAVTHEAIADACGVAGSQRAWARENGISPQFVCDVLQGRRAPSERLARALGYRRVVSFERIEG